MSNKFSGDIAVAAGQGSRFENHWLRGSEHREHKGCAQILGGGRRKGDKWSHRGGDHQSLTDTSDIDSRKEVFQDFKFG